MIITCSKCFSADDVLPPRRLPDRLLQYRCTNQAHGDHDWFTTREAVQSPGEVREGVTDELLEPLNRCVDAGDPFVEYGIVEHRLRALGRLERMGELVSEYGPATGAWRYNGQVTYWARATPSEPSRRSWAEYCAEAGRSPEWTDDDRLGLRTPSTS